MISSSSAICMAVEDLGVKNYVGYPGTPASHIGEYMVQKHPVSSFWSVNEKTALEAAFGMCFAKKPVISSMKTLGVNVALDMLSQMSHTAMNAPIVIFVGDDVGREGADDLQDARFFSQLCNIPIFEPCNPQESYDLTLKAFEISDKFSLPVLVRINTNVTNMLASNIERSNSVYKIQGKNYIYSMQFTYNNTLEFALPRNAISRIDTYYDHKEVSKLFSSYVKNIKYYIYDNDSSNILIICSGFSSNIILELNDSNDMYSIMKINLTFPLNKEYIIDKCSNYNEVIVIEDGRPFLADSLRRIGIINIIDSDEIKRKFNALTLTNIIIKKYLFDKEYSLNEDHKNFFRLANCCTGCLHVNLSDAILSLNHKYFIASGIGCYAVNAFPHVNSVNVIKCMGSPIAISYAFNKSSDDKEMIAIIGDGEFWHTGINGLIDAKFNNGSLLLIIQDNGTIAMTGGQRTVSNLNNNDNRFCSHIDLTQVIKGLGVKNILTLDNPSSKRLNQAIEEYMKLDGIRVIIHKGLCVKYGDHITRRS